MSKYKTKKELRERKHMRLRKKISGTAECPRLSVFFSLKHASAQIIDDVNGKTIVASSTTEKTFPADKMKFVEKAKILGGIVAKKAIDVAITKVVFDRGGFKYTGKVKAFADAAREAGLKF